LFEKNRDNMTRHVDVTLFMKDHNLSLDDSKAYITITTPAPYYRPINPTIHGIQANLEQQ